MKLLFNFILLFNFTKYKDTMIYIELKTIPANNMT